jgi:hypothetical protein
MTITGSRRPHQRRRRPTGHAARRRPNALHLMWNEPTVATWPEGRAGMSEPVERRPGVGGRPSASGVLSAFSSGVRGRTEEAGGASGEVASADLGARGVVVRAAILDSDRRTRPTLNWPTRSLSSSVAVNRTDWTDWNGLLAHASRLSVNRLPSRLASCETAQNSICVRTRQLCSQGESGCRIITIDCEV